MVSKKSFLSFTGFAIVVVLGLSFYYISTQQEIANLLKGGAQVTTEREKIFTVPATGDIDDATEALLKEADDESSALSDLEGDVNLIDSDSQEVDDFGQSVNENDF
jgi:hypothetical protein